MQEDNLELKDLNGRQIFISFRSRDEPQVFGLKTLLANLGNTVIKMGEFPAGRWGPHIYKSLAEADTLLVYLSHEPQQTRLRRILSAISGALRALWRWITRRSESPRDWMREEYEYFKMVHGEDSAIIVYAEEGAPQPDYLQAQQFHYYVSQLTEIRQKWNHLRKDKVSRGEARKIIIADLKKYGIDLDERTVGAVLDLYGVQGLRSALRYTWIRSRAVLTFVPIVASGIAIAALSFEAGQRFLDPPILEPTQTQVSIRLNQNGRMACGRVGLVCTSVSQRVLNYGRADDNEFYGYATPTCESRLRRSNTCAQWGWDYAIEDTFFAKSARAETRELLPEKSYYCMSRPVYEFANCVDPLGD